MGSQALRVVIAVALLAALAAGLVWALRSGDEPAISTPTLQTPVTTGAGGPASSVPASVAPPIPEVTAADGVEADVEAAVAAANAALTAWGEFAVSKDLGALRGTFLVDGPQFALLEMEARSPGEPLGPPPYSFVMERVALETATDAEIVLRADLVFGRSGEAQQLFTWDIVMRPDDGSWKLWTVAETEA